jgi:hypothetical protein
LTHSLAPNPGICCFPANALLRPLLKFVVCFANGLHQDARASFMARPGLCSGPAAAVRRTTAPSSTTTQHSGYALYDLEASGGLLQGGAAACEAGDLRPACSWGWWAVPMGVEVRHGRCGRVEQPAVGKRVRAPMLMEHSLCPA